MDGWVTRGVHHWGGGLFPMKMFDVAHRQGRGRGGVLMQCIIKGFGEGGFMVG